MAESIKAFLKGYLLYKVNDEYFFFYQKAKNKRLQLCHITPKINVEFIGFHIFYGWLGFYYQMR